MRRGLLPLAAALLLLPGCHDYWGTSSWGSGSSGDSDAAAHSNVRATIPALEAYYADHGSYSGATLEGLRDAYDSQIPEVAIYTNAESYCVESTVGGASYFKNGPVVEILPGLCGDPAPPSSPPPSPPRHTDAEAAILDVIPAIEAFHADTGTYAGLEAGGQIYGLSLSQVRIFVRKGGTAYCVEAPRSGASAHFEGPSGPPSPGPC
jgi:hypothetical protein